MTQGNWMCFSKSFRIESISAHGTLDDKSNVPWVLLFLLIINQKHPCTFRMDGIDVIYTY